MEKKKINQTKQQTNGSKIKQNPKSSSKQIYSIYNKIITSQHTLKSNQSQLHKSSHHQSHSKYLNCSKCSQNQFTVKHLVRKYFADIQTQTQNKYSLNIIDDFIQNYATSQTISTTQAFKYANLNDNIRYFYTMKQNNAKQQNLVSNLALSIRKNQYNVHTKKIIHFFNQGYNIVLTNIQKHKILQDQSKKQRKINLQVQKNKFYQQEITIPENNYHFEHNYNSNQTIKKFNLSQNQPNFQKILKNSQLISYSMIQLSGINQNTESQKFIKLVNQVTKVFDLNKAQSKRKIKIKNKINYLKSKKPKINKLLKRRQELISGTSTSRSSVIKLDNKKNIYQVKKDSNFININNKLDKIYLLNQLREISSIRVSSQQNSLNKSKNQIISSKNNRQNYGLNNIKKQSVYLSSDINYGWQQIKPNYNVFNIGSTYSKTSCITPNHHTRIPSQTYYHEKEALSSNKNKKSSKTASNSIVKFNSCINSHTSTPQLQNLYFMNKKDNNSFYHEFQQKQLKKKTLSKVKSKSKSKDNFNRNKLNNKKNFQFIKTKNHKKRINEQNKDKQNYDYQNAYNEYGIQSVKNKNKKVCIISSLIPKFSQIGNIGKIAQIKKNILSSRFKSISKQREATQNLHSKRSYSKNKQLSSRDKLRLKCVKSDRNKLQIKNSSQNSKQLGKKMNSKSNKISMGGRQYQTCNVSMQKGNRREVYDDYLYL